MAKGRRRRYGIFINDKRVGTAFGLSTKEALDVFQENCGFDTLEEFCAEHGALCDDLVAVPILERE